MRDYMCTCLKCGSQANLSFNEPYPQFGDQFVRPCKHCNEDTTQTMVLTKRLERQLHRQQAEEELRSSITDYCHKYGFTARFLYESVIITTPISSWQFPYHDARKTLYHESTIKINFNTGDYANMHVQFQNRKMTCEEVIDYIAAHDAWREKERSTNRPKAGV